MVLAELDVEMDSKMAGLDAPSRIQGAEKTSAEKEEEEALMDVMPDLRAGLDAL